MKIGLLKPRTDLAIKHIQFIIDGKEYYIAFHYSLRYGIKDVSVHGKPVKIIDAYPAFPKLVKICAKFTLTDFKIIMRRIVRKMKDHTQSDKHR